MYRANGTLDIAAARDLRSKRTQWHAWSALSEQIRLRNELWATWQRYKFSAKEHRPSKVAPSDRASVPVERHASADLVSMITIAQGQAGRSARLSDVNSSTSQVSRQAGGRAANEHGGHRDINSDASPASLAAGGYGGPCRGSRKPHQIPSRFACRRDAAIWAAGACRPASRSGDLGRRMLRKNIW